MPTEPTAFTTLFANDVLSRVERLRLVPRRRRTERRRGEHLSGKGGQSIEFSDFRDYVAGDDIRYVDWNIFSRLNRAYVKLYHHEEELHVVLLIDASASMGFEGKLLRARQLAAAMGVMGLFNVERVSAYAFNSASGGANMPSCTGRASLGRLLRFCESIEPGGDAPVELAIEAMLRHHRGRGIAVLLSDFLTFGDVRRAFNGLSNAGLETFGVQILCPTELDPEVAGDLRLIDSENEMTLDVSSAGNLLGIYHEYRLALQRKIDELIQQRGGRFLSISSQQPLDDVLFDQFRRKGWVR